MRHPSDGTRQIPAVKFRLSNFLCVFKATRNGPLTPSPQAAHCLSGKPRRRQRVNHSWATPLESSEGSAGRRLPGSGVEDAAVGLGRLRCARATLGSWLRTMG